MTITNMSIILYALFFLLGIYGLVAGIVTGTVHNIVIGLFAGSLAVTGYITTKRESNL